MANPTINGKPPHPAAARLAAETRAGGLDRREFLTLASSLGLTAAAAYGLLGLSAPQALAQPAGKPGGTLRVAMTVMPIEECRSIFDTIAMGTPAANIRDAAPCRRSCSRTWRRPAAWLSATKRRVTYSGRSGVPFSRAKTRSWSS